MKYLLSNATREFMPEQSRSVCTTLEEVTDLYARHKILCRNKRRRAQTRSTTELQKVSRLSEGTRTPDLAIMSGSNRHLRQARREMYHRQNVGWKKKCGRPREVRTAPQHCALKPGRLIDLSGTPNGVRANDPLLSRPDYSDEWHEFGRVNPAPPARLTVCPSVMAQMMPGGGLLADLRQSGLWCRSRSQPAPCVSVHDDCRILLRSSAPRSYESGRFLFLRCHDLR